MITGPLKLIRRVDGKTGTRSLYERGPKGPLVEVLAHYPEHQASALVIELRPARQLTSRTGSQLPLVEGGKYRLTKPRKRAPAGPPERDPPGLQSSDPKGGPGKAA